MDFEWFKISNVDRLVWGCLENWMSTLWAALLRDASSETAPLCPRAPHLQVLQRLSAASRG